MLLACGCSQSVVIGTSTTTVEVLRAASRVRMVPPVEALPMRPEPDELAPVTFSAGIQAPVNSPSSYKESSPAQPVELSVPAWSAQGEMGFFPASWLRANLAVSAGSGGVQSAWAGFAWLTGSQAVTFSLRTSLGGMRGTAWNRYLETTTIRTCSLEVCRERVLSRTEEENPRLFSLLMRVGLSIQAARSGPWLDVQGLTPFEFAQWNGRRNVLEVTRQYHQGASAFGSPSDSSWIETERTGSRDPDRSSALQLSSVAVGWCERRGDHQFAAGVRYFPWAGNLVQPQFQWTMQLPGMGLPRGR